jgi:hypothetical protein
VYRFRGASLSARGERIVVRDDDDQKRGRGEREAWCRERWGLFSRALSFVVAGC